MSIASGKMAVRDRYADIKDLIKTDSPMIIDAGANYGSTTDIFLQQYPSPCIHLFEPNPALVCELQKKFSEFRHIHIHPCALGSKNESIQFHIINDGYSSSIFNPSSVFKHYHGDRASIQKTLTVPMVRLENELADIGTIDIMKLDLQGYELEAFKGCGRLLQRTKIITTEVEFTPLYENQPLFAEIDSYLRDNNFKLLNLYDLWTHPDGQLTSGDAVYINCSFFQKQTEKPNGEMFFQEKSVSIETDRFKFYQIGFHCDHYLLKVVDSLIKACDYFIETGTNVGTTIAYVNRTYPHVQCLSCEPDRDAFQHAVENTPSTQVKIFNETSQDFLVRLQTNYAHIFDKNCLFWLDAHGYGFEWPLNEELAFITSHFKAGLILIDDFKVPGLECFGYDMYQDQECSFEFIKRSLDTSQVYHLYYPTYTETTSPHHPLRGWVLISFGIATEPPVSETIKSFIREEVFDPKDISTPFWNLFPEPQSVSFDFAKKYLNPHLLSLDILPKEPIYLVSVDPFRLLSCHRFDIVPKYVYAKFKDLKIDSPWGQNLYKAHIEAFNNFDEGDGSGKSGAESFLSAFDTMLDSINKDGFEPSRTLVPIDLEGVITDGAHRVAACLYYRREVIGLIFNFKANHFNYEYFQRKGLSEEVCDAIALEYCLINPQTYVVTLFPSAVGKEDDVRKILLQHGDIFYARKVKLNKRGSINLIRQMYAGESWVGDFSNQFEGAKYKASECFKTDEPARIFVYTTTNLDRVVEAKQKIRNLFEIENHSIHINDTHKETVRLAQILLNSNSIHFLNNALLNHFPGFQSFFENYKSTLNNKNVDGEYLCIDGSAVMAAYGIREARDLDYLHFGYNELSFGYPPELIGSHNDEINHHVTTRDDIIFNPHNHFYYDGVKFASLGIIRALKLKRGEKKDLEDIRLIDEFVHTPPSEPHRYQNKGVNAAPVLLEQKKSASGGKHHQSNSAGLRQKIVGLVPARNENNIISHCLRSLSKFTDAIVYLDDNSTDGTLQLVESLISDCKIERIIRKDTWYRDEPGDRNMLLNAGRDIGGTHFVVIDADEMFTANLLQQNLLRESILKLLPGESLALTWIQLWRDVKLYRCDDSQWSNDNRPFIFCDDGACYYQSDFIHTQRVPTNLSGKTQRIPGYEYGVLHFQFVNWRNLLIKQAWYRCLERIRDPKKTAEEINSRYAPSKDEQNIRLLQAPEQWFQYSFFDQGVYLKSEVWREAQVVDWFRDLGEHFFKDLDIWDINWDLNVGMPKISIVTPSYNQGDYIEKTITSVLDQNYPNLEFIIIDGGSTDQTVEILKKYSGRLTYWCSEKDNGQSDAINKGLAISTGEIFNWLCSDDYLEPDALFKVAEAYQSATQASGWVGACRWVDSTYKPIWTFYPHSLDSENFAQNFNGKQLSQPSCFLNTRVLKEIGGVDQSFTYAMDFDLWLRMLQKGTFSIGSGVWSSYYFHSEAKTVKNKELSSLEACKVQRRYGFVDAAEKRLEFFQTGESSFWPFVVPDSMQQDFSQIAHSVNRIVQFNTERKKILFISTNIPSPDNHAADKRICLILKILLANNFDIHFAYLTDNIKDQQFAQAFDNQINFYRVAEHNNFKDPEIFLRMIQEVDPSSVFITNCWWYHYCLLMTHLLVLAERNQISARFIVDTMDFHYKHYMRKFNASHAQADLTEAENFLALEDEFYSRADCVVVVTEEEKNDILKSLRKPIKSIQTVPTIHDIIDLELHSKVPMEERFCNICFVGNFGAQHNVDAVRFFIQDVFPLILNNFPQTGYPDPEFHIIGINLEPYRQEFESAHIKVIGYVEDLQSLLAGHSCKIMVCPLVYGSGIKGKIGDAACVGLPFVTTSIGAEGFPVRDGVDCFIADNPAEFASKCIQLMTDNVVWHNFSIRSRIMVHNNYSLYAVSNKLKEIVGGSAEMTQELEGSISRYERILAMKEQGGEQPVNPTGLLSDKPSKEQIYQLLMQIQALPSDWHKAGTLDVSVLAAFVKYAADLPLEHSLETGSGKSTLLFSNISRHHLVFAINAGDSITCVKRSSLFNQSAVEYIEGPTQTTLPYYRFNHKLDFALIDGPHGYPFPEIEYYFIYQHLKEGAILVVDDIHIPTIFNLFKFLLDDNMFEFLEVVNQTTAFFRRTSAPLFSPTGDGWWEQKYNKKNFPENLLNDELRKLLGR